MSARILGIDYGSKRVGIAVSDALGITAQPLPSHAYVSDVHLARHVASLCTQWDIATIVLGHPIRMDGTRGEKALEVERCAEQMRTIVVVPIVLWDERLTTVAAQRTLIAAHVRREQRKRVVDQMAAVLLLQQFMDAQSNQAGISVRQSQ
jgi:putative Holliday junction resolvase